MTIRVWLTSRNGEGYTNHMDFDAIDEIEIYTDNIGRGVKMTFEVIDDSKESEEES